MQLSPGLLLCNSNALAEKGRTAFFPENFTEQSSNRELRKREKTQPNLQRDLGWSFPLQLAWHSDRLPPQNRGTCSCISRLCLGPCISNALPLLKLPMPWALLGTSGIIIQPSPFASSLPLKRDGLPPTVSSVFLPLFCAPEAHLVASQAGSVP